MESGDEPSDLSDSHHCFVPVKTKQGKQPYWFESLISSCTLLGGLWSEGRQGKRKGKGEMHRCLCVCVVAVVLCSLRVASASGNGNLNTVNSNVIEVKGGPESVVWVVQLSDLHFSVHHPERALDFQRLVAPVLSIINPSLVLITGDLTDGKSRDLLIMKQNELEWVEYQSVMEDVIAHTGLDKTVFYDLRGNHDNFGVPLVGGPLDFFSKYSISGLAGRTNVTHHVNSVTLQTHDRLHLFVGFDTTMSVGVQGPTNLFGHLTDHLLAEIDSHLSQWDSASQKPVTKISFGHFPLSFSTESPTGRSLKDVFLKHSLSAYICGHLHSRFGKNLKRHHDSTHLSLQKFFQLNIRQGSQKVTPDCSFGAPKVEEFWEWEMGDWRKSRAMRILAIDNGHVSYTDIDLRSGVKDIIIVPTFPLDSRFMSTALSHKKYECQFMVPSSYETIRALVFSFSSIEAVVVRIYDTRSGNFNMVLQADMTKHKDNTSRGDIYCAPWNYKAFEDPSPDRYWLQIEARDVTGHSSMSELRPFSVNGLAAGVSWTWKEFFVMGCQWASLYMPILWCVLFSLFLILLVLKTLVYLKEFTYRRFIVNKSIINFIILISQEISNINLVWFGIAGYLLFLVTFPWFIGQVFTDGGTGYMTYKGWVVRTVDQRATHEYLANPDIMVVVIPHLVFVVLPTVLVIGALAAERGACQENIRSMMVKKEDDYGKDKVGSLGRDSQGSRRVVLPYKNGRTRKFLLMVCLAICWKHTLNCRALMKAYDMNPIVHFPGYSIFIPLLLAYAVYKTRKVT